MIALAKIIDLETKMQVYNLFNEGKTQKSICTQFNLTRLDIQII